MISSHEFQEWLRGIKGHFVDKAYLEYEAQERSLKATLDRYDLEFQGICAELRASELRVASLKAGHPPWWRFWALDGWRTRLGGEESALAGLIKSRREAYSKMDEARHLLRGVQESRARFRSVPELWRSREREFGKYVQGEYSKLLNVARVRSCWISDGALIVETERLFCTGFDTDGSHLRRLLGVLRISFLPLQDPKVYNTTRYVTYRNDQWDAPHHPRGMGSCWGGRAMDSPRGPKEPEPLGLLIAKGEIADAVVATLSALSNAKPLSEHEQWGVPVLRLFPPAEGHSEEIVF